MRRPALSTATAFLPLALVALLPVALQPAQAQCPSNCKITTANAPHKYYDFSRLKGKRFTTTGDGGVEYSFTLCGTDKPECPNDGAGVFTGMSVQKQGTDGCYVLGVYDNDPAGSCQWLYAEPGGAAPLTLELTNGSPYLCNGGEDRQLAIEFKCPSDTSQLSSKNNAWTAKNPSGTCLYAYTFETCIVCDGGCTGMGGGWGTTFLLVLFLGCLPAYLLVGSAYNYKQGARGLDVLKVNKGFWTAFCGSVQTGCVFCFSCGRSTGEQLGGYNDPAGPGGGGGGGGGGSDGDGYGAI